MSAAPSTTMAVHADATAISVNSFHISVNRLFGYSSVLYFECALRISQLQPPT